MEWVCVDYGLCFSTFMVLTEFNTSTALLQLFLQTRRGTGAHCCPAGLTSHDTFFSSGKTWPHLQPHEYTQSSTGTRIDRCVIYVHVILSLIWHRLLWHPFPLSFPLNSPSPWSSSAVSPSLLHCCPGTGSPSLPLHWITVHEAHMVYSARLWLSSPAETFW